jgi:hypothetical protein
MLLLLLLLLLPETRASKVSLLSQHSALTTLPLNEDIKVVLPSISLAEFDPKEVMGGVNATRASPHLLSWKHRVDRQGRWW